MAPIFAASAARVVIEGRWDGQLTNNILYFKLPSGDPSLANVQQLADVVDSWYGSSVLPNLGASFTYLRTTATAINVAGGFEAVDGGSTGDGGTVGETVPNNVNPCISFRTSTAGRSFRGRNYVPGLSNGDVVGNEIQADWMAAMVSAYNELLPAGANDPTPWVWGVMSFFGAGAPRGAGLFTPIFTATFADNTVDSQRRRLPGRGR